MPQVLTGIFTAFGLSASAGLNAYIPLLLVGLTARFTNWISLSAPFDLLSNEWVLGVLGILLSDGALAQPNFQKSFSQSFLLIFFQVVKITPY